LPTPQERIDRRLRRLELDTGEVRRLADIPTMEMPAPRLPPRMVAAAHEIAESRGVSDRELAEAVGVKPGTVRAWWAGRRIPGADRLERVFDYLKARFTVTADDDRGTT
jgi:ribosome-binding protein aMBF1 (putative translation factor)